MRERDTLTAVEAALASMEGKLDRFLAGIQGPAPSATPIEVLLANRTAPCAPCAPTAP